MEEFIKIISNVGFPIAVASYLLLRLEPIVKDLQQSISGLALVIAKQTEGNQDHIQQLMDIVQKDNKR